VVIRGHPRSSVVIRGQQRSSVVISGQLWSAVVIRGHQEWLSVWHSVGLRGTLGSSSMGARLEMQLVGESVEDELEGGAHLVHNLGGHR